MSGTAPSAHDDFLSLPHRLPRPPHPHPPPSSTASTVYTGSFVDDGADLLTATHPGFGLINTRFYKPRRRHLTPHDGDEGWSADVARAVGGDVARCLAKAQALGEIWGRGEDGDDSADENSKERGDEKREERGKERERRKKGIVTVPAPLHWRTFVIKSGDGRVVVVGKDGEWDSGPVAAGAGEHGRQQRDGGKKTDNEEVLEKEKRKREARLWIRAPRTPTASLAPSPTRSTNSERGTGRHARGERASSSASVSASTYTYDSFTTSTVASPLASQTQFFMTGGLGGWPESTATPEPESKTPEHGTKEQKPPKHKRTVPHAITWAETPMGGWGAAATATGKETEPWSPTPRRKHKARSLSTSTTRTTTPPLRPANAHRPPDIVEVTYTTPSPSASSLHPAYPPPDIVEVTYASPPSSRVSSQPPWSPAKSASAPSVAWSRAGSRVEGSRYAGSQTSKHSSSRVNGWGGGGDETEDGDGGGWSDGGKEGWGDGEGGEGVEWDGFERPKAASEVSVCGGSVRSGVSWRSQRSGRSQRSQRSHGSDGSRWTAREDRGGAGGTWRDV